MALVLDTGVLYAAIDRDDRAHHRCRDLDDDHERVAQILDKYDDQDVGFVDAAVLAITERLGEPKLATLDHRHFAVLRPRHVDALDLLP